MYLRLLIFLLAPAINPEKYRFVLLRGNFTISWVSWMQSNSGKHLESGSSHPGECIQVAVRNSSFLLVFNIIPLYGRRRQWHPTPVLLTGKSHGRRSLVGCSPWDRGVGHDWATSLSLFTFMHWRRKWQPTLVFLPGESQGRRSLVGCRLWGHTDSDTTEAT